MEDYIRELLNSSRKNIEDKENELKLQNEEKIKDFIATATNNQITFYEKVIEDIINSYVNNYINNHNKVTVFKFEYDDINDKENEEILELLRKTDTYSTAFSNIFVFGAVDKNAHYMKFPSKAIIFVTDQYTFDMSELRETAPVLVDRDDFLSAGFYISYSVEKLISKSNINLTIASVGVENFMNRILDDEDKGVTKFKTENIINLVKDAKRKITEYEETISKEKRIVAEVEQEANNNLKEAALNICQKIIDNYDPTKNNYITKIKFLTLENFVKSNNNEQAQMLRIYRFYRPDNKIILFSQEAKLDNAYIYVDANKLEDVINELASTVNIDKVYNEINIFTDTSKFADLVLNRNRSI